VRLSIITPAFNEAANLPVLHERLAGVLDSLAMPWEWVIVDDHSRDDTFDVIGRLAAVDSRVTGLRLARNSGSHTAITCGLHYCTGDGAAMLAGDLQDSPDVLALLVAEWRKGARVIWAARASQDSDNIPAFSRAYYFVMRHIVGLRDMPAAGADCFLIDRVVIDGFRRFPERNSSVFALITWMGFPQTTVFYSKQPRLHGKSAWSLTRKVKLLVDSITAFSLFPVRALSGLGCVLSMVGIVTLIAAVIRAAGPAVADMSMLLLGAVLFVGGTQLVMAGVLGEYLWRVLDESRGRPRYLVEATVGARARDGVVHT
jgi:polyisoprenyl-phosphate glycosyltransferase